VEVFTDHKNLTYFSETKTYSWHLARWSEFLSQFNLSIKFQLEKLGKKPDTLTWRWDIYKDNLSKDFPIQRLVFTRTQLIPFDVNLGGQPLTLQAAVMTNLQSLISDIKEAQKSDQLHTYLLMNRETTKDPRWTRDEDSTLYYEGQFFMPNTGDLWLQVLKTKHDHVLAEHPGQSKTYQLVH